MSSAKGDAETPSKRLPFHIYAATWLVSELQFKAPWQVSLRPFGPKLFDGYELAPLMKKAFCDISPLDSGRERILRGCCPIKLKKFAGLVVSPWMLPEVPP